MHVLPASLSVNEYLLVYNALSFVVASMGASTFFFFMHSAWVAPKFKTALTITGLVTLIAFYHYLRIFNSWTAAYTVDFCKEGGKLGNATDVDSYCVTSTGAIFNDAYRYMDWLLTVPLLLIEIVLVMKLSPAETVRKATLLGIFSGLMIIFGYPGEMIPAGSPNIGYRWLFWAISLCPFIYVVYTLTLGTKAALDQEADPDVKSKINTARIMTIVSWLTYPVVYIIPCIAGSSGVTGIVGVQIGYTISDIISKCGVGILIYKVTYAKTLAGKDSEPLA